MALGLLLAVLLWTTSDRPSFFRREHRLFLPSSVKLPVSKMATRPDAACVLPKLDPFHPDMMKFFHDEGPVSHWVGVLESHCGRERGNASLEHDLRGNSDCAVNCVLI